jgi:hypothetical protein
LRKASEELRVELARTDLAPERRAELVKHSYAVAGALASPLLPVGLARQLLAALFVVIALSGISRGEWWFLVFLAVAACFSPRIVGEVSYALGRASRR